ncbi:hypothetical protein [Nocardioides solisilvae]|uniref:hypothetical protein n=1 Tax=Nocardioides solisilvae TaxID=1542435 RepID=UPI000D748DCC|nr:hypothetical protein [Nocardioides solisilvae]
MSRPLARAPRLLAVAALLLPLAACGGGDPAAGADRELEPGDAVRVLDDTRVAGLGDDPALTMALPTGTLGLGWSTDADLLATVTADDGASLTAADGAELVALAWDVDTTQTQVDGVAAEVLAGTAPHELVLVSGDQRTTISPEDAADGERAVTGMAVVAVEDADDLALEATFDGVTQTVGPGAEQRDVPDEAAPLYEEAPAFSGSLDCGAEVFCRVDAAWLPWVSGEGWAEPGTLWPVVRVEGRVPGARGEVEVTTTLDGVEPLSVSDLGAGDGRWNRLVVLPATAPGGSTLAVEATGDGVDPVTGEVVLTHP